MCLPLPRSNRLELLRRRRWTTWYLSYRNGTENEQWSAIIYKMKRNKLSLFLFATPFQYLLSTILYLPDFIQIVFSCLWFLMDMVSVLRLLWLILMITRYCVYLVLRFHLLNLLVLVVIGRATVLWFSSTLRDQIADILEVTLLQTTWPRIFYFLRKIFFVLIISFCFLRLFWICFWMLRFHHTCN